MKNDKVLYIKNMVCQRCIKVVREELTKLNVGIVSINLGEVNTSEPVSKLPLDQIRKVLQENGFELIEERRARIIETIKTLVINTIRDMAEGKNSGKRNFSDLIVERIGLDYPYLSSLFSSLEGITIEQFIILQKIEKTKELLKYDEMTLSEISDRLAYSSVQHLSNQFKKVTGLTAGQFKNLSENMRRPLDSVS